MTERRNTRPLKTALGGEPGTGRAKASGVRGATPSRPNARALGQSSQRDLFPADIQAAARRGGRKSAC